MTVFNSLAARTLVGITGTVVGAAICLGAAVSPAAAHAADRSADAAPTVKVSYADLDLASQTGRAKLDRRIANAAHLVCTTNVAVSRIETTPAWRACVRRAVADATTRAPLNLASASAAAR